jgi:isopentenyl diphosphate isomerase/L-lactate dehydrogenase-like FMN-dependent dehydrogenase
VVSPDRAGGPSPFALSPFVNSLFDATLTWSDLDWLRGLWSGPLVVKGVMSPHDAALAAEHGADAVVVSNHGGRQLDGAQATLEALPAVVDAVGDRLQVLLDGGIRRGADIAKAVALGARACMIGRPYLYGLAVGGQDGVARTIRILTAELRRTMALMGCTRMDQLGPGSIARRA